MIDDKISAPCCGIGLLTLDYGTLRRLKNVYVYDSCETILLRFPQRALE